jgi:glycosyltransferase involved in cell wall biosynthesis
MIRPEIGLRTPKPNCRISILLLDWNVRESFHTLHYLNQQTVPRDQYELIWLEFYDKKPLKLQEMVWRQGKDQPLLDQWIVAGYPSDMIFNKHRLYNLGILISQGQYCVICDSDAIYTPNFVAKLLAAFDKTPSAVIHLDQIRNADRRFHPFAYPSIAEVLGEGCINWHGDLSRGLDNSPDILHDANYGSCMAASRDAMLAIGGADEHIDYLGYICGPYDMTFRLVNHGLAERWLRDEYSYHVWHPNEGCVNIDYQGPNDGRGMSLRSLESRRMGRVQSCLENPWIRQARQGKTLPLEDLLQRVAEQDEPSWRAPQQPNPDDSVFLLEADYHGFNLFRYRRHWYALRLQDGYFDPGNRRRYRVVLDGKEMAHVKHLVDYYNALPRTWWGRLANQPLSQLPRRAVRKIGKELSRLF